MAFIDILAMLLLAVATPVPAGNPGDWATTDDYPLKALANREQGTVLFKLLVNDDGTPRQCTIIESSGHAELDTKTCELMMVRARFAEPGDQGFTSNIYQNRVRWSLPSFDFDMNLLSSNMEGFCGFGLSFNGPGETKFALVQDRDLFDHNRILVAILNNSWVITSSDKITETVKVVAEKRSFWNQPQAIDNGILLAMDPVHVKSFAYSDPRIAVIYKGKSKIGQVDMRDFRRQYLEFEKCSQRQHR